MSTKARLLREAVLLGLATSIVKIMVEKKVRKKFDMLAAEQVSQLAEVIQDLVEWQVDTTVDKVMDDVLPTVLTIAGHPPEVFDKFNSTATGESPFKVVRRLYMVPGASAPDLHPISDGTDVPEPNMGPMNWDTAVGEEPPH